MKRPRARNQDVLTTDLDDELIVYDIERKWAHSLNRVAACVWRHCDGHHAVTDLQRVASVELGSFIDEETIALALRQLHQARLLVDGFQPAGDGVTRREMLRKARRVGAAAVVAPAVFSALVPAPAAAQSCTPCGSICVKGVLPGCCPPCTCKPLGQALVCLS
jgi:hypothetical protein